YVPVRRLDDQQLRQVPKLHKQKGLRWRASTGWRVSRLREIHFQSAEALAVVSFRSATSAAESLSGGRQVVPTQTKACVTLASRCGSVSASAGASALPAAIRSGVTR